MHGIYRYLGLSRCQQCHCGAASATDAMIASKLPWSCYQIPSPIFSHDFKVGDSFSLSAYMSCFIGKGRDIFSEDEL
eukprot:scaffold126363_cov52-Attheya_sp.AAC.3